MIQVIPAIDIKGGKVVRLVQGAADRETVYSDDPLEVAERLASFKVGLIHVVDLDGALEGKPKNLGIVKKIAESVKPKVEFGGGARDEKSIRAILDAGIAKVVVGTKALDEEFLTKVVSKFKGRIVAGIDAREGIVYTKGWVADTGIKAVDLVKRIEGSGIDTINYTDIATDGMLQGPNLESLKIILGSAKLKVVASGGISRIEDVKNLKALEKDGLAGMIIGKAIYEKRIDLAEAIRICSQKE